MEGSRKRVSKTTARKRKIGILHARKTKRGKQALETIRTISKPYQIPKILTYLRKLDPFVFEELLLTVLEEAGYTIKRNKRYTHDGGADGVFTDSKGTVILIQAKCYSSYIKSLHVKQFSDVVSQSKATYGVFIHTGRTGQRARFRKPRNVTIISGNHLTRLLLKPTETFLRRPKIQTN